MPLRLNLSSPRSVKNARRHRRQRLLAVRSVRDNLVSLAGVVGAPVLDQMGEEIGRLADVVARWDGTEPYPAVTGLVVKVGRRNAFFGIDGVERVAYSGIELRTARIDLRDFSRREGEVLLWRDILDHQLVDVDGVQVIRAADLYLAQVPGGRGPVLRLVGADVSTQTLLRRLGPKRWRGLPTPDRVIDWAAIQPFGGEVPTVQLRSSHSGLRRLRPGELADLLEDLGRDARAELLSQLEPGTAADALEEMEPEELGTLLREIPPEEAAALIARMEPDEAVDALRDLEEPERDELLEHMTPEHKEELSGLLGYREDRAGGFMTSHLALATFDETVGVVRDRLREQRDHAGDLDGVVVLSADGTLLGDLSLFALAVAGDDERVGTLLADAGPVTARVDASSKDVAALLIETRHSSIVVVDDDDRPVGRILADDLIDALLPERGRFHFPRLLS